MSDELKLDVSGGAGGVQARYQDMYAMAGLSEQTCGDLLALAAECHGMLADPDLLASAVLNPAGAAAFEMALLTALDGPGGLTHVAGEVGLRAVQLRAAAVSYQAGDAASAAVFDMETFFDTAVVGASLPLAFWDTGEALLSGGDASAPWQRLLSDHPGFADQVLGKLPVGLFLASGGHLPFTVGGTAGMIALLYPDGRPGVDEIPFKDKDGAQTNPPRNLEELMAGLNARNEGDPPQIDVRVLETTMPDGSVQKSYIVDIPGTKDWSANPGPHPGILNDLPTNLHSMAGDPTSYAKGIGEALAMAGAGEHDNVMLVGHSQGGMTAVRAATELGGQFNVTHVVTAGSPVGHMPVPDNVQVLSLQNEHDLVPHLDASDNPPTPNRTTVSFSNQTGSIGENHGIATSYVPAAAAVDASNDPSVRAYHDSAGRFFSADRVSNHAYTVTRHY